jgi:hypothetical protein
VQMFGHNCSWVSNTRPHQSKLKYDLVCSDTSMKE